MRSGFPVREVAEPVARHPAATVSRHGVKPDDWVGSRRAVQLPSVVLDVLVLELVIPAAAAATTTQRHRGVEVVEPS